MRPPTHSHRLYTIALASALVASASSIALADWPTFRGDAARTGIAHEAVPDALRIAWSRQLGESVDSSPAVANGRVYVGADNGFLYCLDADDGSELWRAATGGAIVSSPALGEGIVYVGSVDRCLYAFSITDGAQLWRVRTRKPVLAPPLVYAGRVYFGSMDGTFRCVDAIDGKPLWQLQASPISGAAAADTGGTVYFGDYSGAAYALDAATGTQVWKAQLKGSIIAAPLSISGKIIVGVMGPTALTIEKIKYLVALDATTGAEAWSQFEGSSVLHTPVADEKAVYFGIVSGYTSNAELHAVDLATGKQLWKRKLGGVTDSSPILVGDRLLFGLHDNRLHIVRTDNGNDAASVDMGAKLYSSAACTGGKVYIGAGDGKLYCLQ